MKSNPYAGISTEVESAARAILRGADSYHSQHVARLARTVEILVGEKPKGKMLELGTSGFVPLMCSSLLPDLEIHASRYGDSVSTKTREFSVGNSSISLLCYDLDLEFDKLPVEDATYDFVMCCEVLEHMEIDPMFMLAEINRVLKTGGTLLLTTPNVISSRGLTKMLSGVEPYFFMHYHISREYHRHNYEYSATGLMKLLKCAGFTPKVWTEDLFEDGLTQVVTALREAGFTIEDVGDNLIAVAKKTSSVIDRYPVGLYV